MRPVFKISTVSLLGLALVLCFAFSALAHGVERADKKGILLVAFGTTVPSAEEALKNVDKLVKKRFPKVPVRWAYSSKIVRGVLAEGGRHVDSPAEALARMADEDFTQVAVQSLHTIPGAEYHALKGICSRFQGMPKGIERIVVGHPLLATNEDVREAVNAVMSCVPASRAKDEALVLMGHGTHHPGNIYYVASQYYFSEKDPLTFVGTVEGSPSLDDVLAKLKSAGVKKACLMPFMAVAGDHAMNDMAGGEPDSWKSVLTKAGIKCQTVLEGTASCDRVADIWVEHLETAYNHLH